MASKPTFLLLSAGFSTQNHSAYLGRFVTTPSRPLDDSTPSDPSSLLCSEPVVLEDRDATIELSSIKNKKAQAALKGLIEGFISSSSDTKTKFESTVVRTYRLVNHLKAFKALQASSQFRDEIDGDDGLMVHAKGKMFMIVGMKTLTDARVESSVSRGRSAGASISMPLSKALGTPSPADPSASVELSNQNGHTIKFKAMGERVFAVEYKVIKQRNIFGRYSVGAKPTQSREPVTHDWNNATFGDGDEEEFGSFEDDEDPLLAAEMQSRSLSFEEKVEFEDVDSAGTVEADETTYLEFA